METHDGLINGAWHYTLRNTGANSQRLGPCEVCGQHAAEVSVQKEMRDYTLTWDGVAEQGRSIHNIKFGHESCLTSIRKENKE